MTSAVTTIQSRSRTDAVGYLYAMIAIVCGSIASVMVKDAVATLEPVPLLAVQWVVYVAAAASLGTYGAARWTTLKGAGTGTGLIGLATVIGPMLGGFIVVFLRDWIDEQDSLRDLFSDPNRAKLLSPAIFGIALILLMYVLPDGIVGGTRRAIRRIFHRRRPAPPPLST